jgi:CPA2 family monovalent cation:H+ antiporter-2
MELEFLRSLVLIFGVSAIVVFGLGKFRISSIVGFLVAGVILGPHGLKLINDDESVHVFAEIGVILLMFTIGLEFSLKNLMMLRTQVFYGGVIQVILTIVAVGVVTFFLLHQSINSSILEGFIVAMSSTAIVVKSLMERGEVDSPQGKVSIGILLFQDLCVVPFMLFIQILSGKEGGVAEVTIAMIKSFTLLIVVLFGARWVVPYILHEVLKLRNRELFIITIIFLCTATAFLTSKLGLSLALGAFLAGIIISESEYASQAIADVMPFKESFIGLFFISIGMLMDTSFLIKNIIAVLLIVFSIVVLKVIIVSLASLISGQNIRISIISGFYLAQIGEFSFIVALAGKDAGLLDNHWYQIFLSASVLTMFLTPFISAIAPEFSEYFLSILPSKKIWKDTVRAEEFEGKQSDHVIIIGFGITGRNLAKVLKEADISYVILEMNPNTVKRMKKEGEPIYYGDGTSIDILRKMKINMAKVLVVAISDSASTRRIVKIARIQNPRIYIIVRTKYITEIDELITLGANEVIPEDFEASVEIFSRVLHYYNVPKNVITEHIDNIRKDHYAAFRIVKLPRKSLVEHHIFLKGIETETYFIKEGLAVDGQTIKKLQFRTITGVTIIAVQRGEEIYQNPSPDFVLKSGDIILLVGKREDLNNAIKYLESKDL